MLKPYYEGTGIVIYHGDCRDVSVSGVSAVVTDPPYGLKFMGKGWDKGVPGTEFWGHIGASCVPGAHMVAFGGTRTHHRLMCAIEDAGWEIRDCLVWLYGSGFPKSLDVSKAIDKAAGVEREDLGMSPNWRDSKRDRERFGSMEVRGDGAGRLTLATSTAAKQWDGWGTALKPAHEIITLAQKPYDLCGECGILVHNLMEAICQLPSYAKTAGLLSTLSQNESGEACGSVLWTAVEKCSTPGALSALMDTLPSGSVIPLSLNIALSWLVILGDLLKHEKTFTTETAIGLTTDLRTLNCSPSPITPATIIEAATGQPGTESNALLVGVTFSAVAAKLKLILARTVQEPVTSSEFVPNYTPIVLARKPFRGTVASNVQEHGTGALNVDACRIKGLEPHHNYGRPSGSNSFVGASEEGYKMPSTGRWPANVVLDEESAAMLDEQAPVAGQMAPLRGTEPRSNGMSGPVYGEGKGARAFTAHDVPAGASRFFYCAKASRSERGGGNTHPTVKPLALMSWLIRLVTPPGGLVLDPFMGSGSTLLAAQKLNFPVIGIDNDEESCEIAVRRLSQGVLALSEPSA